MVNTQLDAVIYFHRHDEAGVEEIGSHLAGDENIASTDKAQRVLSAQI
jgi:hypothetical protein